MMNVTERLKSYEPLWENWYLDGYISSGSSGYVYRFKQNRFGEDVFSAVKVMTISVNGEINKCIENNLILEMKKMAENEIKNMYMLTDCKNIVHCKNHAIKNIYNNKGEVIAFDMLIQMDMFTSLAEYLSETSDMSEKEVLNLAIDIAQALKEAHSKGIVHRDIKPANIFMDLNGNYLLGDFGVAKQLGENYLQTRTGTEPYMSPEIWNLKAGETYTESADIYSYGILLYTLLNNNFLPMINEHSSTHDIMTAVNDRLAGKRFAPPANGSNRLKDIVMRACSYDPKDRQATINEILDELLLEKSSELSLKNDMLFKSEDESWWIDSDRTLHINNFKDINYKNYTSYIDKIFIDNAVTIIPTEAFSGFSMYEINFPEKLEVIESKAFKNCNLLDNINLLACTNISAIGDEAFYFCTSIKELILNDKYKLNYMGVKAFAECIKLKKVELNNCKSLSAIEQNCFENSGINEVSIKYCTSLKSVNESAFYACKKLEIVDFSDCIGLKSLNRKSFALCYNLKTAIFSNCSKLSIIRERAFWYCKSLSRFDIPNHKIAVFKNAFQGSKYSYNDNIQ